MFGFLGFCEFLEMWGCFCIYGFFGGGGGDDLLFIRFFKEFNLRIFIIRRFFKEYGKVGYNDSSLSFRL